MADLINPLSLEVGQYVSFTCYHTTDLTVYAGKVLGRVTYDIARTMEGDIVPYYSEVAKVIPDIAPYSTLTYFILEYQQGDITTKIVRAAEWIDPSSLMITDPDAYFDIRIYQQDKDTVGSTILDILKANNYTVGYTPT